MSWHASDWCEACGVNTDDLSKHRCKPGRLKRLEREAIAESEAEDNPYPELEYGDRLEQGFQDDA